MARSAPVQTGTQMSVAQSFLKSIQSQLSWTEIMDSNVGGGEASIDMLHPESCAWLEGVSRRILQAGNLEARFSAVLSFGRGYDEMMEGNDTACTNYTSYVLRQGIILNELVRGLREMVATKFCYVLPKDGAWSQRSGNKGFGLISVNYSYTCILTRLATDKRARKYILAQFPDLVDILLRDYDALAIPGEIGMETGSNDLELQSKTQVAASILLLNGPGKALSKRFMKTMLQDAVAASKYARLLDDSIMLLQKNMASLNLISPMEVLTVVLRVLEGSKDKVALIKGVSVLSHMMRTDSAFGAVIRKEGALLSNLLALALADSVDEMFRVPVIDVLLRVHPKLSTEKKGSRAENLAKMKAVALKDKVARRKKLHFDAIFRSKAVSEKFLGEDFGSLRSCKDYEELMTLLRSRFDPLRKCSRTDCENVESSPREFKMCSQCRFTSYCSADCQKLAWKQGHKGECKRPSGASRS